MALGDAVPKPLGFCALWLRQQAQGALGPGDLPWKITRPVLLSAGSSRRSGCVPAVPYPPLEQIQEIIGALKHGVSRFRFPRGL